MGEYDEALRLAGYTDDPKPEPTPPALYVDTRKPPRWYRTITFAGQLAVLTALAAAGTTAGIIIVWLIAQGIDLIGKLV